MISPVLNIFLNVCPLCDSNKFKRFARISTSQGSLEYLQCKKCGLVFQSPQMDEITQQEFYATNYRSFVFGQSEPPLVDVDIQNKRAKHLVSLLKPYAGQLHGKVHVDIGCGLGILDKEIQLTFGTLSIGIEPDNIYRQYAMTHQNLPVYSNLEDWKESTNDLASLITISHVLEHLPDPIKYLSLIRTSMLSKDGYLLLEVPNLLFHYSFELAHTYAFSPHTLREILKRSGYVILFQKKHGIPLRSTPRYITIIAQPDQGSLTNPCDVIPELPGVHGRRVLGLFISRVEDILYRVSYFLKLFMKRIRI